MPRPLAPAPAADDPIEPSGLEFFFIKTAPQLAGFFGDAFFLHSVLQQSLAEPAIRQGIAAIGILHEQMATGDTVHSRGNRHQTSTSGYTTVPSARFLTRFAVSPNVLQLLAMTNVIFTRLEIFQGNATATAAHITAGIKLLQAWRDSWRQRSRRY